MSEPWLRENYAAATASEKSETRSITDSDITNDNTDEVSRALNRSPSQRLALRPEEIAEALGVGRSFVYEHVLPELRVVRRGRVRLVPVSELADWLERSAARL